MISHLLNRTLSLYRESTTADGVGGQVLGFTSVGSVPARVSRSAGSESNVGMQEGAVITEDVYLVAGQDVRRGDFLTGDGENFEVMHVVQPSASGVYTKAGCRREVPAWAIPIVSAESS
jgi:head-tail adaptor